MDAEIELEIAQGSTAQPPSTAQESQGTEPDTPNLLVVRKVSVSRMLSLPNDSYMFRPVAPAAAPHSHPLQEVEMETYTGPVTSAHSPSLEPRTSFQVPSAASSPARVSDPLCALSPRDTPRSLSLSRILCRQEAMHAESLEGQIDDAGEDSIPDYTEPAENISMSQAPLGTLRSPPCSPRPASVRTRKHTFGQHCISSRPPTLGGDDAEAADPADEEVSHITSSAHPWPATEPHSPEASPTASPAKGTVGSGRDPHRFCSVDAQSFLDKPGRPDAQRWSSVELDNGDGHLESGEVRARASELEPALGARRKKKMSPPCISIDPPTEDEGSSRPPAAEGGNTTLRRRTPSCEAALHRDCPESTEGPGTGGDPVAKGERWGQASCRAEHLTVPNFAFEPLDMGGPGGDCFLDSDQSVTPEPRVSSLGAIVPLILETELSMPSGDPPEKEQGLYLTVPQTPLKKPGSPPATPAPDDSGDEPVDRKSVV